MIERRKEPKLTIYYNSTDIYNSPYIIIDGYKYNLSRLNYSSGVWTLELFLDASLVEVVQK